MEAMPTSSNLYRKKAGRTLTEPNSQNLKNHAKFDPAYHFVAFALLLFLFVMSIVIVVRSLQSHPDLILVGLWAFVLSVLLVLLTLKIRTYPLKVQDRVIRLEERLRLSMLLDEPLRRRIPELTEDQLIALRFASDEEVPKLVGEVFDKNLGRKEIKEKIETWRPDHWRV